MIGARSAEQLSETRRECLTHTPSVSMVIGDVSEEGVCRQLVETAVELYGGVDIVIINAAMTPSPPEDFVEMSNPVSSLSMYKPYILRFVHEHSPDRSNALCDCNSRVPNEKAQCDRLPYF